MAELGDHAILVTICLATIILFSAIFAKTRAKGWCPPSLLALPTIGQIYHFRHIPHQGLHKPSTRYESIVSFYLDSKHFVIASASDIVEEFLKTNETSYLGRPKMANFDYLTYGKSDFFMAPYGMRWKLIKNFACLNF
ncbi:hypothetical protein CRYUN_Cryun08bG0102100 [Craigia yunnanensis]